MPFSAAPITAVAASGWSAEPAPGDRIGERYRVTGVLGRGGMGAVYRVVDDQDGAERALKILRADDDQGLRRAILRFQREFHTMARLVHPRIVEVFDYGVDGARPFYTLELLDGRDLRDTGRLEISELCSLLRDVASALAFLHTRRLLHRDLAPRNVRHTSDGRAKLIDFGVLATVGAPGDLAGTPPFVAPESLRGAALDHRTDLFGLGALAYWLLARRHAYPCRDFVSLEEAWRDRPPPPSTFRPDVPEPLDDLVMGLLSLDRLARPAIAGEVIDRLTAIGGLPALSDEEAAAGLLAVPALAGRDRELAILDQHLQRAVRGRGTSVLLEASSGNGKTRVLQELALLAQVSGATVLSADGGAIDKGPYGVIRQLAGALLTSAPREAVEAARPRAHELARILPELRRHLSIRRLSPTLGDPAEERVRIQEAVVGWFRDVTAVRPLLLSVDDVQRADEASMAALVALAHASVERSLLLAGTLRTDEAPRAATALAALRAGSQRLRIEALDRDGIATLCRGLFGNVRGVPPLAEWLEARAGGNPLHTLELLRALVERGVVRHHNGMWSWPEALEVDELPSGLVEAMDARILGLNADARHLGEVLSVHGGELPLGLCTELASTPTERTFAALDELVMDEVLVGSEAGYRFRHDGLREAFLRGLTDRRRRQLHLAVGRALHAGDAPTADREAEIGWHLWHGGDHRRGAELLARAGRALWATQSFSDAIPALEAALEHAERQDGLFSARECLELRRMLMLSGCMADRRVAHRHADRLVAEYRRCSGVDRAERLAPIVGGKAAIAAGMALEGARWLATRETDRGPHPKDALEGLFVCCAYAGLAYSFPLQLDGVRRMLHAMAPLRALTGRVPHGAYLLTECLVAMPLGHWGTVRRMATEVEAIIGSDRLTPLSDNDRIMALAGAQYLEVAIAAMNMDPRIRGYADRVAETGLRFFDIGRRHAMIIYHRFRGEEEQARAIESDWDVLRFRAGSMWGHESQQQWMSALAYGGTGDVLGLESKLDTVASLVEEGYGLEAQLALAQAEHRRCRGEHEQAVPHFTRAYEALLQGDTFVRQIIFAAEAENWLALGELDRARATAERGVTLGRDPDSGTLATRLRSERAWSLADAKAGRLDEANTRLERALDDAAALSSPVLSGSLHEAAAMVAVLADDPTRLHRHTVAAKQWFRGTKNPALVARAERLDADQERRSGPHQASTPLTLASDEVATVVAAATPPTRPLPASAPSMLLGGCRTADERADRTASLLATESRARAAFVYLVEPSGPRLVSPRHGLRPPSTVTRALVATTSAASVATVTRLRDDPDPHEAWLLAPLRSRRSGALVALTLLAGPADELVEPPTALLESLARELEEAGDALSH